MGTADRPNILLISTDEQRYDTLGVSGNTRIRTPHLDALSNAGAFFERPYIQNTVCIPSRACLQTGRYTHQHGVTYMEAEIDNTPGLPDWEVTFMERLQAAGYRTGATGKMHMMPQKGFHYERLVGGKGSRWTESEGGPLGPGPLGPTYASWLETRHPGGYEAIYEQRRRPEYKDHMTAVENVLPLEEYVDRWISEEAIEFLNYTLSKPFFLWCSFCGPHGPIDPPKPYTEMYPFEDMTLPRQHPNDPQRSPKGRPECRWKDDVTLIQRWISYYWGLVTLIDDEVGRILKVLDDRGLRDNTLIAFVSDHGEMAGDYNLFGKGNFYEETIRVPLVVVPPGGKVALSRVPGLVETNDLAATFLDYAGVDIPPQMAAQSLRPVLEGTGETRESIFCEQMDRNGPRRAKCVRTDRYKYIFAGKDAESEFYDMQEDPFEEINRYGDPAYREEIDRHKNLMLDRLMNSEQFYHTNESPTARELQIWLD